MNSMLIQIQTNHPSFGVKKNIICFSDLNHTTSQINRGGNIVCFRDDKLARIMRKSVQLTDKCF